MDDSKTAISKVADLIEERGWFNLRTRYDETGDSYCVVTAFCKIYKDFDTELDHQYRTKTTPLCELADWLDIPRASIGTWNDAQPDKATVLATLREFVAAQ